MGVCSFFVWRCTRRSECRRAEEKNGWLWSPRQQCVKIVSFYPPNLSCKKTQKVLRRFSISRSLFVVPCSSFRLSLALQTCLTCTSHKHAPPEKQTVSIVNRRPQAQGLPASLSIHLENSKLAYYNRPGWLCSQPEDVEPLLCTFSKKIYMYIFSFSPFPDSHFYIHKQKPINPRALKGNGYTEIRITPSSENEYQLKWY